MIEYQAHGKHGSRTEKTPKKAARAFFEAFPNARKCDVVQGESDGQFFTVSYGRASAGEWPQSYKDVTRKTVDQLPD